MRTAPTRPILGVLIAIAITAAMDAAGLSAFSALPLFPLMGIFWCLEPISRRSMGFSWGQRRHYAWAVLYPVLVLGTISLIAASSRAVDLSQTNWNKAWLNLALITISTILMAMVTEEGFFRGWLWASLERTGATPSGLVVWTSIAFSLWHVSPVVLQTGFDLPRTQIPLFLVNAALLGAVWGRLRWISGSVVVASVSHGVWNGITYALFGYGTKVGALGIEDTALFGPEVGILGLVVNLVGLVTLWWWGRGR